MEPEYDERGNIPGPGPSREGSLPEPEFDNVWKKENYWIDQLREGTLDVGKQILDSFVYGGAAGVPAMRTPTKIPKLPVSGHKTINITPKGVDTQQGSKIINQAFGWRRFHSNSITQRGKLLSPQGLYPKGANPSLPITDFDPGSILGMDGQEYALQSTIRQGKNESNEAYIRRYWNTKFDELNIPEGVRFNLREMLDSDNLTKAQRRNIKSGISNPNYIPKDYKESRQILVHDFLDGLEAFGIDPSTIEIHHISSLRHVSQLFEGLEREKWPEMLAELYKAGLATGNDPNNLMAMFAKAHRSGRSSNIDSVHQYLDNELGKYNEQITGDFGDNIRELSVEERIPSITRYAQVRQSSVQVANNAIRQVLDEIILDQGGSMDALIDNVVFSQPQIEYIQSKIKQHLDMEFNPQGWGALEDAVKDDVSGAEAKQNRGLSPSGPTQGQLMDLGKKKSNKKKTSKNQKKYDKDPDLNQGNIGRDETKPMDPPPDN